MTFPDFFDGVTQLLESLDLGLGLLTHFMHGFPFVFGMVLISVGETSDATVIETPLKLVDGLGAFVVAVHPMTIGGAVHESSFTSVADVGDSGCGLRVELTFFPMQPF